MPADTLDEVAAGRTASPRPTGSVPAQSPSLGNNGEPIAQRRADASPSRPCRERFDPLTYVEGGKPTRPTRSRSTRAPPTRGLQGRRQGRRSPGRAPAKVHARRHRHARRLGLPRRRAARALHAARGAAGHRPATAFDEISVAAAAGHLARAAQGRDRARARRASSPCATGKEQAEHRRRTSPTRSASSRTALLVFAGVALLVGGFLIFNTFSVTVAQRTREFALLRTLGASRAPGAALGARRDARDRRPRLG